MDASQAQPEITDLPPGPWSFTFTPGRKHTAIGQGHVYIVDANGRKIASIWGSAEEKVLVAEMMIAARNNVDKPIR